MMAEMPSDPISKVGIRIEKPIDIQIHSIYPILVTLSILLIVATAWLLISEYLGEAPPMWLRSLLEDFALTL